MRSSLLLLLLCVVPAYVLAADAAQTMDIPDSEPVEEAAPATGAAGVKDQKKNENTDAAATNNANDEKQLESNVAVLRGLNKVIGRVSTIEVPLGTIARFDNLEIIARKCWKSPPEDRPENAILLEVREIKAGEAPKQIFLGWMFSSSPSISGLEHPVYDITAISCEFRKDIDN